MRFARSALVVIALVGAAGLVGTAPRASATDVVVGTWWQANTGAGSPTPPTVQPGQAWLSSVAAGPTAVTAIRFATDPRSPPPPLVLKVASAQPDAKGSVTACPATSAWQPATAGPWATRPTFDCTKGRVQGITSADGATVLFDLSILDLTSTVDVVLSGAATAPPTPSPAGVGIPVTPPPYYETYDVVGSFAPPDVAPAAGPAAEPAAAPKADIAVEPAPAPVAAPGPTSTFDPAPSILPVTSPTIEAPSGTVGATVGATPVATPFGRVATTTPVDRPGRWRIAVAVVLVAVGLEASRRLSGAGAAPLGGLKAATWPSGPR